jgi:hypothetical protein
MGIAWSCLWMSLERCVLSYVGGYPTFSVPMLTVYFRSRHIQRRGWVNRSNHWVMLWDPHQAVDRYSVLENALELFLIPKGMAL